MKRYDYIIFDIDDTLLDYQNAETHVMEQIFEVEGKVISDKIAKDLWDMSCLYWDKYHLDDSREAYVQENYHKLFFSYLRDFMADIQVKYAFHSTVEQMTNSFMVFLSKESESYDDTEIILQSLSQKASLVIASNGFGMVQRSRIQRFREYFSELFISEELGIIKPNKLFWDKVFEQIKASPENCLMVGDSLQNDIISAANYGIDTCWVNRKGKTNTTDVMPTYEVRSLIELLENNRNRNKGEARAW